MKKNRHDKIIELIARHEVETQEQLDLVTGAGCNMIQGYYFSKPVEASSFVDYVKHFNVEEAARVAIDEKNKE